MSPILGPRASASHRQHQRCTPTGLHLVRLALLGFLRTSTQLCRPYTLHSTLLDITGLDITGHYWTLLRWSLLHVRLAAQRGELAVALGAARLVARAQAAQLVLEPVLSCLRISVASRVHSSAWSLRQRGAKRVNACMRWMSRWSGGTRARAPMQVQGRRAVTEPVVRSAWPPKRLCVGRWVARTWC